MFQFGTKEQATNSKTESFGWFTGSLKNLKKESREDVSELAKEFVKYCCDNKVVEEKFGTNFFEYNKKGYAFYACEKDNKSWTCTPEKLREIEREYSASAVYVNFILIEGTKATVFVCESTYIEKRNIVVKDVDMKPTLNYSEDFNKECLERFFFFLFCQISGDGAEKNG